MFLRGGGGAPEVREEIVADGILSLSEALSDSESDNKFFKIIIMSKSRE